MDFKDQLKNLAKKNKVIAEGINKANDREKALHLFAQISFLDDPLANDILKNYFQLDHSVLNEFKLSSYLTKIDREFWVVRSDIKNKIIDKDFDFEKIAQIVKNFIEQQQETRKSKALKYELIYSNISLNIKTQASEITHTFLEVIDETNEDIEIMKIIDYQLHNFINNAPTKNITLAQQEAYFIKAKLLRKMGQKEKAEKYFKYVIDSKYNNEVKAEALQLYGHLLHKKFHDTPKAKELLKKSLDIFKRDTFLRAKSLSILGNLYKNDFDIAKKYFDESLKIETEINNKRGQAQVLHDIGILYQKQKHNFDNAKKYFDKSLQIGKDINDKRHQAQVFQDIGILYKLKKDFKKAKENFKTSIKLKEEVADKKGKAQTLHELGILYQKLDNNFTQAKKYFDESLKIGKDINDKRHQAQVLHDIGILYQKLKSDFENAKKYFDDSLKILKEINDKGGQAQVLHDIGLLYQKQNHDFENAKKYFDESLKLRENKADIARVCHSIGILYEELEKDFQKAKDYFEKSLQLHRDINNQEGVSLINRALTRVLNKIV